ATFRSTECPTALRCSSGCGGHRGRGHEGRLPANFQPISSRSYRPDRHRWRECFTRWPAPHRPWTRGRGLLMKAVTGGQFNVPEGVLGRDFALIITRLPRLRDRRKALRSRLYHNAYGRCTPNGSVVDAPSAPIVLELGAPVVVTPPPGAYAKTAT